MLFMAEVGDYFYPGDYRESENWPYIAPGEYGVLNAISPKYMDLSPIIDLEHKIPIFWIHGGKDLLVSDNSPLDIAYLGIQGFIPGYPGLDKYPPQPMYSQIKYVLESYSDRGGDVDSELIPDSGHTPFLENRDRVIELINGFLIR